MKVIKVVVMNTSKEVTEMLETVLASEGFETQSFYTYIFKEGKVNIDEYIITNKPDVIVYDIAIPYKQNYDLFKKVSESREARDVGFVLTTTNKDALESIVGKTNTIELIGKPYDLNEIIIAVKAAYEKKRIA